jgi:hypothetical protein
MLRVTCIDSASDHSVRELAWHECIGTLPVSFSDVLLANAQTLNHCPIVVVCVVQYAYLLLLIMNKAAHYTQNNFCNAVAKVLKCDSPDRVLSHKHLHPAQQPDLQ